MQKRFGIDIDGTVTCPSTFIPYLNKAFQLNLTMNDITEYDLVPILKVAEKEIAKWFSENEAAIYATAPLAKHAQTVLHEWREKHELYYISARHKDLLDITEQWFNANNIHFHHIELIGTHDKIAAAKHHNIDIFFEDKHDNACDISEECGIPVLLFDTPYNRLPVPRNVIRIHDWLEAKQWVDRWLAECK